MSEHSQIIAELGYKRGNPRRTDVVNGIRSDGKPLTARVSISDEKRQQRERARRIEDMALAKELGISLNELCEGKA